MNYPLGWSLLTRLLVRRERWPGGYNLRSQPLVRVNEHVRPEQPVMRLEYTRAVSAPSEIPRLSLPATSAEGLPGVIKGQRNTREEIVPAGLRGVITEITARGSVVIESQTAVISGALGAGQQVAGPLTIWQSPSITGNRRYIPPGAILVVPGPLTLAMLRQALHSGIAGIVASSISPRDFEGFLRTDLLVLLNCTNVELMFAHLPPLTIMLTEGLGTTAMPVRTLNLLSKYHGSIALLSGASSTRAQIYPELVISLSEIEVEKDWQPIEPELHLATGALVRICSGSYEGAIGVLDYIFAHQQRFPSGVRVRAARVKLEDGSLLVAPLQVLKRIG